MSQTARFQETLRRLVIFDEGFVDAGFGLDRAGGSVLDAKTAEGLETLRADRADDPSGMAVYARLCGWTLAREHARPGDRIALAACLGGSGKFAQAIAGFAEPAPTRTNATTPRSGPP
jgi:hypothetical protein